MMIFKNGKVITGFICYSIFCTKKFKNYVCIDTNNLNLTDLIITKMFRGTPADSADCIAAFATGQVDAEKLLERYSEAARYDLNPEKAMQNFAYLAEGLHEVQLINDKFFQKVRSRR